MMGGAVAAAVRNNRNRGKPPVNLKERGRRQAAYEEQERFWADLENHAKMKKMLQKYDKSKTNTLNKDEVGDMLQDLNKGVRPTDEEITWVLHVADSQNMDLDNELDVNEIEHAIDAWHSYTSNANMIKDVFNRYDINNSGQLEKPQLKAFLTELNEGVHPTDQEVDAIMREADGQVVLPSGGINKTELMFAISLWYTHTESTKKCLLSKKCVIM
eukprot:CAMPEP_0206231934 /NCGR_PEP_ID=MMETSP0047_2-20121206/11118_1 /ASSEMBLY_ACC=CAM_ASM_000192 /TAXON_ID=195065 /ORGANISM="Chroomonas mesostigmatica_cf, Strain CCMP1168" /LENGTH=214 /DNA_ID=CAMNT_0053655579 /DNA_START=88 /DNA_END=732 /DNA_ORIENTATION=+